MLSKNLQLIFCLGLFVAGFLPTNAHAHDALRKLSPVVVLVKDLNDYGEKAGLKKEVLQKLVEETLRDGGVPVTQNADTPQLEVMINVAKFFGGYAGTYRLQLRDWAGSLKDPSRRLLVSTWEKGGLLTSTKKKLRGQIEKSVKDLSLDFVSDFKEANKSD